MTPLPRHNLILFGGLLAVGCSDASQTLEGRRPNILIAIADDQSFPFAGAYGCNWIHTPAFDRVAAEGLLFTNCYTPNAKSAPSRACLLTGRYSWQLEEAGNHIGYWPENRYPTFCEVLARNGYYAAFTGKGWAPGNPRTIHGKPRRLTGIPYQQQRLVPPTSSISKIDYAANFEQFLRQKPEGSPWVFWFGSHEPHRAYEYQSGVNKGGKSLADIDRIPPFWPDNDTVRHDLLDHAYEIEYFDFHLGRILDMLEASGELDNTIVVVTADNGMPFPRCKGLEYEYSNHLPLAVMWPDGIRHAGRTVAEYVSLIDWAPTFLRLAGVDAAAYGMAPSGCELTDLLADIILYPDGRMHGVDHSMIGTVFCSDRNGMIMDARTIKAIRFVRSSRTAISISTISNPGCGLRAIPKRDISIRMVLQPRVSFWRHGVEVSRLLSGNFHSGNIPRKSSITSRRIGPACKIWPRIPSISNG